MEQLIEQAIWCDMSGQIFTLLDSESIVCAAAQLREVFEGSDLNIKLKPCAAARTNSSTMSSLIRVLFKFRAITVYSSLNFEEYALRQAQQRSRTAQPLIPDSDLFLTRNHRLL
jgi:hypothetical protein